VSGDPYCYPGTGVLRNLLGVRSQSELDRAERQLVQLRIQEGTPEGNFDLKHLQAIHRHLFQDIYDWAGEVRQVEISKGGNQFQFRQFISTGMADIHKRLVAAKFLRGLSKDQFAEKAGEIIGDVNYVHPFREGNGRTQLEYLRQLADHVGHNFSAAKLDPAQWLLSSRTAHLGDYRLMSAAICGALTSSVWQIVPVRRF
jgi:cell filamentation protein